MRKKVWLSWFQAKFIYLKIRSLESVNLYQLEGHWGSHKDINKKELDPNFTNFVPKCLSFLPLPNEVSPLIKLTSLNHISQFLPLKGANRFNLKAQLVQNPNTMYIVPYLFWILNFSRINNNRHANRKLQRSLMMWRGGFKSAIIAYSYNLISNKKSMVYIIHTVWLSMLF